MNELERFQHAVTARFGLAFDGVRAEFLEQLLEARSKERGVSGSAYLQNLEAHLPQDELRLLAAQLTVGETYFFRHGAQLRVLAEVVLPMHRRHPNRRIRILSAGCASGEEAYSLVMTLRPVLDANAPLEVVGVDLNPQALERAARGRFSSWSLRETSPELTKRWFRASGRDWQLHPEIRGAVRFEERNLMQDDQQLYAPDSWDVIFCRNVLMYFDRESARDVIRRFRGALHEGGYLFLGHAETLRGLSTDYNLCHTHDTFYYRRKAASEQTVAPRAPSYPAVELPKLEGTWVEAIQHASDRIRGLQQVAPLPTERAPIAAGILSWDPSRALALLERERYADAIVEVERVQSEDPDALLLHAALLVHTGRLEDAERVCTHLMAIDALDAPIHYVRALCREGAADRDGALECDRTAIHLDPTFAMPHLHLGLLYRRAGELELARSELTTALLLLATEEPSRLLLFGGGFKREALIAICRTELARCGEVR